MSGFVPEKDLPKLRKEIVLNSLYYSDYENSFGYTTHSVCDFFDGYMSFLEELARDETGKEYVEIEEIFALDNDENLYDWFCCFDEFPFVKEGEE